MGLRLPDLAAGGALLCLAAGAASGAGSGAAASASGVPGGGVPTAVLPPAFLFKAAATATATVSCDQGPARASRTAGASQRTRYRRSHGLHFP